MPLEWALLPVISFLLMSIGLRSLSRRAKGLAEQTARIKTLSKQIGEIFKSDVLDLSCLSSGSTSIDLQRVNGGP
jgi:hypothetical protein